MYICRIMESNKPIDEFPVAVPQEGDGVKLPDDPSGKWKDIEHLPQWDEKYYYVYTARKHGKWVMLKALKPELQDDPVMKAMIEKEFDVRYNLAHPHIIMINDFEDVPGIGRCIITDDVYGNSLRRLIDTGKVTETILKKITSDLVDALEYIQENHLIHHPLRPESILFTEKIGNLKVIDVGFDQLEFLSTSETGGDLAQYGKVLEETLDALSAKGDTPNYAHLRRVARECQSANCRYHSVQDLKMDLNRRSNKTLLGIVVAFLVVMAIVLIWLHVGRPIASVPVDNPGHVEDVWPSP